MAKLETCDRKLSAHFTSGRRGDLVIGTGRQAHFNVKLLFFTLSHSNECIYNCKLSLKSTAENSFKSILWMRRYNNTVPSELTIGVIHCSCTPVTIRRGWWLLAFWPKQRKEEVPRSPVNQVCSFFGEWHHHPTTEISRSHHLSLFYLPLAKLTSLTSPQLLYHYWKKHGTLLHLYWGKILRQYKTKYSD